MLAEDPNIPAQVSSEDTAILAAKAAAGISYKLLVIQPPDFDDTPSPQVAFRRPKGPEWHRYRTASLTQDPEVKAGALQLLVIPCLLYPSIQIFQSMVELRPGLMESLGGELLEYAGLDRAKKVTRL
jgi:hypothetical protein